LAAVEAALADMRRAAGQIDEGDVRSGDAFDRADVTFHQAMALAGGNRVLTYLFEAMEGALLQAFEASRNSQPRSEALLQEVCDEHARIIDCVRARDAKAATEAMHALIMRAEVGLRLAMEGWALGSAVRQ
ncbi:MAG: FadR family transcriptional regulator, partial [Rubellimicrobium sp.]|nr:FadR family transcriptional regulator [Rubellimicrobium sp.]